MDERVDPNVRSESLTPVVHRDSKSGAGWVGRIVFFLVLAGAAGGGWYWWTHRAPQSAPARSAARYGAANAPQPVGAATVDKGDIRIYVNALGTVSSLDTVTVQTQISGQLQEIGFKEGQIVHKGDFLAQIDPRPYLAALEQVQGTLAKDQGLLAQAQANLKRYQTLSRQDSISQQQVDDQKYLVQQDTGIVQTDQGLVETAKLNLSYCRIVSPIDGRAGLRLVDQGNYVQSGSTTGLVVITQTQPISVLFAVPEDALPDIVQRLHAQATLPVDVYDRSNARLLESGTLAALDAQISTTTGTLNLRAIFANTDEKLYPNQFVNARLLVNTMSDAIRVPVPAVQRGEPGTFVYLIGADGTVSVRPVKLGPIDGGYQAVLSGLAVGDQVVTDGTDRLKEGAKVIVPPPASAAGQPPGGAPQGPRPRPTRPQ
jgi:multidrug efflux system membrane fusion protein